MSSSFVYIVSNKNRTTTYIGVTSNLERRIFEHKTGVGSKFSAKYNLTDLIYFEEFHSIIDAIAREKQLKRWHKEWKWNLIKNFNPDCLDLASNWYDKDHMTAYKKQQKSPLK